MSEDIFEAFGEEDIFEEEEPEEPQGTDQNRTFIIAVAVLGGLLVCALAAFGVWALVLNRPQEAQPAAVAPETTQEAVAVEPTEAPPTDTPEPTRAAPTATPTPLLGPTATPTAESKAAGAELEKATPTATREPRRSPTPTRTPRPTSTPRAQATSTTYGTTSEQLSQTGLSEWLLGGVALVLIAVIIVTRKLRTA